MDPSGRHLHSFGEVSIGYLWHRNICLPLICMGDNIVEMLLSISLKNLQFEHYPKQINGVSQYSLTLSTLVPLHVSQNDMYLYMSSL